MAIRPIVVALLIVTCFVSLPARSQTGCLTGSVVDNIGAPVKGIRITLGDNVWTSGQISPEPRSDESGQFRIDGIPPGNYNANALADELGYPGIWRPVRQVSVAPSALCTDITFNVGSRAAKLKVIATDAITRQPISNILLDIFPGDKAGLWLPVQPLLSYGVPPQVPSLTKLRIVVTANGYSSSEFMFPSLAPGETLEIVARLSPKSWGCITGVAVDENLTPVVAAKISPRLASSGYSGDLSPVNADDHGKFSLDNLRPGEYVLWPEKESDGFSTSWSGWRGQVELQRVAVTPGGACREVTVNMGARGALMRVSVIDEDTHQYLDDVLVIFRNPGNPPQTASIFKNQQEALVPSRTNFVVQVRAPGYKTSETRVAPLDPGERQDLTVSLRRVTSTTLEQ